MVSFKGERFSENVRREISCSIRNLKNLKDRAVNLSVSRVEILAGGRFVKIYISSIKGIVDARFSIKYLNNARGFVKRELSKKLKLKKCPDIEFVADDFVVLQERFSNVLNEIKNS